MEKIKQLLPQTVSTEKFWLTIIFVISFGAFAPALSFKELISDDFVYQLHIFSLQDSIQHLLDPIMGLWTPLTSLSLYADLLLWGEKHFIFGAHLTNIVLHSVNALLFYTMLRMLRWGNCRLTPAWAGMTALIFALHPQRVESVVWICERKDTLAMGLGVAALLFFIRDMRKDRISWISGILLLLSLLAKPMWLFFFVPTAAIIWSEQRKFQWNFYLRHLLIPMIIFLIYLLPSLHGVFSGAQQDHSGVSLLFKFETILYNYGNYFLRTFLPGNLFPLYPPYYNPATDPRWMALIPVALLFTPLLARNAEFRPAVIFGVIPVLICFAAVLIPVAGFVRIGNADYADRYSYLPSIFLLAGAAFLLKLNIPKESAFGQWLPILGILYCGGLLYRTELYIPVWQSNRSIIEYAISVKTPNVSAATDAGSHYFLTGQFDKAANVLKEKLPELPHYTADCKNTIRIFKLSLNGLLLFQQGKYDEGIRCLNAVYLSPHYKAAASFPMEFTRRIFNMGASYHLKKYNDRNAASMIYSKCADTLQTRSVFHGFFYAGKAALLAGNHSDAVKYFQAAYRLNPQDKNTLHNLNHAMKALKERKK